MMSIESNLVLRVGSEVFISSQATVVLLILGFAVYVRASGVIMDWSEQFFMEEDINTMGSKAILREGMVGRETAEEWFRVFLPAAAGSVWV